MKISPTLLFFFLLVLTPVASAQPPQATQVVLNLNNGFNIEVPRLNTFEQSQSVNLSFHVFNLSDGTRLDNNSINCSFELFDNQGFQIFEDTNLTFTDDRWQVEMSSGNFSRLGFYAYLVRCNSSFRGGVFSSPFEVTANGFEPEVFPTEFAIILFSFLLVVFGLFQERLRMFKHIGSILMMIMGVITLFPGYSFTNWTTLSGLSLGIVLIGLGFYFLIEDSFSREKQEDTFEQDGRGENLFT